MAEKERIAELVLQLQAGNKSAFDELYKLTSPKAFYVAFEITKNNQDAEDILQESYITALDKIGTLDKPESFVGWFHRIVANKSKDSLKKKKPSLFECDESEAFEVIPDEDTDFTPESSVDKTELQQVVMSVLDELNEEKRACVLMYYFEECSVNDIAETLDVPVSTVKNRLFTARKDLQSKFSKRGITSAYSVAPIGLLLWAMRLSSDSVSKAFVKGPASAKVLADITAASAGTAATTAATGVAAGGGLAAKVAALTAVQKVAAGVAIAGIVGGSAFGVTAVIKNRKDKPKASSPKVYTVEEVTTSPHSQEELSVMGQVSVTFEDGTTVSLTDNTVTENNATVTESVTNPVTTTRGATTTRRATTTARSTTTTRRTTTTTQRATTTRRATTTQRTTTTRPVTTTSAPTTQAPATLVITVLSSGGTTEKTITKTVPAGTAITYSYVEGIVSSSGVEYEYLNLYEMNFAFDDSAESGGTYEVEAEIS